MSEIEEITLEEIIKQHVSLPAETKLGWYPVLHETCDHGKKGPRAAFKFDNGTVGFNCFNCGHVAKYNPAEHPHLSDNMKQVMDDFMIPESEYQKAVLSALKYHPGKSEDEVQISKEKLEPDELELPSIFYPLKGADNSWAELARYYLEERGFDPDAYPYMLAQKTTDKRLKKWFGRVIIPIYKKDKLIFYTGRDLTGNKMKKYETPAVSKDLVIYGYDKLFTDFDKPLYVMEGFFDAYLLDGCAIFGNTIGESKVKILNRSKRKKVYIPDRLGDGKRGAMDALDEGWAISTPNIGNCKDINDAVLKYGKLYVLKTLAENTVEDRFTAIVKLGVFCG